jgi:hypothetical protein
MASFAFSLPGSAQSGQESPLAEPDTKATEPSVEALKNAGDAAYRERRFADALDAYNRAFQLSPDPRITFNRSRALTALARYPEALAALEEFERTAAPELKARVRNLEALAADLRSRVGTLTLRGAPAGARVLIAGRVVGATPFTETRVNAGDVTLEVFADGYMPFSRRVEIAGGRPTVVDVRLVSIDRAATLTVSSGVRGAVVSVDGKRRGPAPAEVVLTPGSHVVVVQRDGYDPAERVQVLRAGERRRLALDPTPQTPLVARWWFWTGIGVAVAGGVATAIALSTESPPDRGDLGSGQVTAPLVGF